MSLPNCTFSFFLEDFDLGNGLHDHFALLDADDLQDREQIVYNCVKGRVLTWELLQRTLNGLRAEATEHDVAVLPFDMAQFHELLQKFATHTSWPFLNEEIEAGQGHWNREGHTLVGFCIQEAHDPRRSELHSPVPRGFGKERFFLHLFSGRRRRGDFELRAWQITKDVPTSTSIGRNQAGGWSTAALKEYPPALNCAWAV